MRPEPNPDLQALSVLTRLNPALHEFLTTSYASIYGEFFSRFIHQSPPKAH